MPTTCTTCDQMAQDSCAISELSHLSLFPSSSPSDKAGATQGKVIAADPRMQWVKRHSVL